mmetsp:Transcript_7293/g.19496  ORF Transcript_7293/g.19496 Transcript_7293/m.19496 type:complete len:149 (-) Transcript_7293:43-489(-)
MESRSGSEVSRPKKFVIRLPSSEKEMTRRRTGPAASKAASAMRREMSDHDETLSSRFAEMTFQRQRARTLAPEEISGRAQMIWADEPDPSTLRKLRYTVDTGRASSSATELLSPTPLQEILTVGRRNSRMLKERLPVIVEAQIEHEIN